MDARDQPEAGDRRRRIPKPLDRRARQRAADRAARSTAPSRSRTTRTSRAPSPASPRRTRCGSRPDRREACSSPSPASRARACPPTSADLRGLLLERCAAYGDPLVPLRVQNLRPAAFRTDATVKVRRRLPRASRCWPPSRRHCASASRSTARDFGQTVSIDEVAAAVAGRRRGRRPRTWCTSTATSAGRQPGPDRGCSRRCRSSRWTRARRRPSC